MDHHNIIFTHILSSSRVPIRSFTLCPLSLTLWSYLFIFSSSIPINQIVLLRHSTIHSAILTPTHYHYRHASQAKSIYISRYCSLSTKRALKVKLNGSSIVKKKWIVFVKSSNKFSLLTFQLVFVFHPISSDPSFRIYKLSRCARHEIVPVLFNKIIDAFCVCASIFIA